MILDIQLNSAEYDELIMLANDSEMSAKHYIITNIRQHLKQSIDSKQREYSPDDERKEKY